MFEKFIEANTDLDPLHYCDVALPWGLDLGGGLLKYRKAYLTQLQQLTPEERELEWKTTMHVVKFYERKGLIPEGLERQYPQNYEEALRYYGVKA